MAIRWKNMIHAGVYKILTDNLGHLQRAVNRLPEGRTPEYFAQRPPAELFNYCQRICDNDAFWQGLRGVTVNVDGRSIDISRVRAGMRDTLSYCRAE